MNSHEFGSPFMALFTKLEDRLRESLKAQFLIITKPGHGYGFECHGVVFAVLLLVLLAS